MKYEKKDLKNMHLRLYKRKEQYSISEKSSKKKLNLHVLHDSKKYLGYR